MGGRWTAQGNPTDFPHTHTHTTTNTTQQTAGITRGEQHEVVPNVCELIGALAGHMKNNGVSAAKLRTCGFSMTQLSLGGYLGGPQAFGGSGPLQHTVSEELLPSVCGGLGEAHRAARTEPR